MNIKNIIFDLGGVLIDWNPRYLYRKIFTNEAEMEHFLTNICTDEWNSYQDAGRSISEATKMLCELYTEKSPLINAYYQRWDEMFGGAISGTVAILQQLKENKINLYAITNWSHETFPYARATFKFINDFFLDVVVSGEEKILKPDARIYQILLERNHLNASESIFIDDRLTNVKGAEAVGIKGLLFTSPENLTLELKQVGNLLLSSK